MRTLILLRHAHAEGPLAGQADIDRPLSDVGEREAREAGQWLRGHAEPPQRVLVSPARRTRQTWEIAGAEFGTIPAAEQLEPAIYDATPGTLMELLDAPADAASVWLVGHNPGLEQLVALLASGQSGDYRGMPPAGIARLRFAPDAAMEPGSGTLLDFWWP